MRRAVGAGLLAFLLTGCASVTEASNGSAPAPGSGSAGSAPAAGSGSAGSGSAGSGSAGVATSSIPAEALLQPTDLRGATAEPLAAGEHSNVRPLRPCGTKPYQSDGTRTDAVAVQYTVPGMPKGATPFTVVEFVGKHKTGGAAAQFTEIRAALANCPGGLGKDQLKWTVVESDNDSMLVKIEQKYSYGDQEPAVVPQYAALSTVNNAVVMVADLGWENSGGSEEIVRELIVKAEKRAAAIK
jgi:hypothetical protein